MEEKVSQKYNNHIELQTKFFDLPGIVCRDCDETDAIALLALLVVLVLVFCLTKCSKAPPTPKALLRSLSGRPGCLSTLCLLTFILPFISAATTSLVPSVRWKLGFFLLSSLLLRFSHLQWSVLTERNNLRNHTSTSLRYSLKKKCRKSLRTATWNTNYQKRQRPQTRNTSTSPASEIMHVKTGYPIRIS